MQKTPPLVNIPADEQTVEMAKLAGEVVAHEHAATVWVNRITGVVGGSSLLLALVIWLARPNHYRLVLVLLVVAMFAAILHSYTFENSHSA